MSRYRGRDCSHHLVHRIAGICLGYPDEEFVRALPELESAAHGNARLSAFLCHARRTPLMELAAHYTEVFDFKNRRCLYLTWWQDGDTRRRGASLVRFKQVYRSGGLEFTGTELPDFLPVVLDYCATTGDTELLREHRAALDLLSRSLTAAGTPYSGVVEAVCATLPQPTARERAQVFARARTGAPREEVGLGAYGGNR